MNMDKNTTLILAAPKVTYDPLTGVKVSIEFKQATPGDALLFFMGNGDSPNSNAMIAVDIKNNLVRFLFRDDNGVTMVMNNTTPIAAGDWHKVTAEK